MTSSLIQRVIIPSIIVIALAGGFAGLVLGCALVINHAATLRFMRRMNRWISTSEVFAPLDAWISIGSPAQAGGRRPVLGTFLIAAGLAGTSLLLLRLDLAPVPSATGMHVQRWLFLDIGVPTLKWVLVTGCAFAAVIGALMLLAPAQVQALERRLNAWHSSDSFVAAGEKMHTPLEPRIEAHPRTTGGLIAVASLFVVLAMTGLLITRIH
jgi:hypothetical protein